MAHINDVLHVDVQFLAPARKALESLRTNLARRRAFKTSLAELSSLGNRGLSDIGVSRSEIPHLAWQEALRRFPMD